MFDFNSFPFKLSEKTVSYICPKYNYKFEAPIEAVLQFEQEDEWNGLPVSTPPYIICSKCKFDKCVPIDYKFSRGFHHKYNIKNNQMFVKSKFFKLAFLWWFFFSVFLMTFLLYKKVEKSTFHNNHSYLNYTTYQFLHQTLHSNI